MAVCIDFRKRFGSELRIGLDPSAASPTDPWMLTLKCRFGTIYPHGGDRLAVEVDHHPGIARQLVALPGVVLHQDGDREKTFLFDAAEFDSVAAIVLPRKRRRLSEDHKANLLAAGRGFRFGHGSQSEISPRESLAAPTDGPRVGSAGFWV